MRCSLYTVALFAIAAPALALPREVNLVAREPEPGSITNAARSLQVDNGDAIYSVPAAGHVEREFGDLKRERKNLTPIKRVQDRWRDQETPTPTSRPCVTGTPRQPNQRWQDIETPVRCPVENQFVEVI